MELVMRVLVEADDDDIAQWAKQDGVDFEIVVDELREEAEKACKKVGRNLATSFEFIEWEEQ